jgi:hypothetical protein
MFIKRLSPIGLTIATYIMPLVLWAQNSGSTATTKPNICDVGVSDFTSFMGYLIQCIIANTMTKLAVALAVIVFMFGVIRFIFKAANGDAMWSIFAFFIMLSLWGIIYAVGATFGIGQGGTAPIPQLPT